MLEVRQILDERLENPGDTLSVKGNVPQAGYELGGHHFDLPQGIDYDLVLTNAGEGILATGMIQAHVVGTCDRCLDPAEFDVDGEVDEYYLFHAPSEDQQADDDEDDVDFALVGDDHTVDLGEAIRDTLVMETPFVVLCQPDCKGLCPVCGANLNKEDCGHAAQIEAQREKERLDASPFAALRDLDLGDGEGRPVEE